MQLYWWFNRETFTLIQAVENNVPTTLFKEKMNGTSTSATTSQL